MQRSDCEKEGERNKRMRQWNIMTKQGQWSPCMYKADLQKSLPFWHLHSLNAHDMIKTVWFDTHSLGRSMERE